MKKSGVVIEFGNRVPKPVKPAPVGQDQNVAVQAAKEYCAKLNYASGLALSFDLTGPVNGVSSAVVSRLVCFD